MDRRKLTPNYRLHSCSRLRILGCKWQLRRWWTMCRNRPEERNSFWWKLASLIHYCCLYFWLLVGNIAFWCCSCMNWHRRLLWCLVVVLRRFWSSLCRLLCDRCFDRLNLLSRSRLLLPPKRLCFLKGLWVMRLSRKFLCIRGWWRTRFEWLLLHQECRWFLLQGWRWQEVHWGQPMYVHRKWKGQRQWWKTATSCSWIYNKIQT